jgi:diguanylate cyclase (GGDEF)-like protein
MLDAAIRSEGKIIGCVCHEHVGERRKWDLEEVEFTGALADQVAIVLSAVERRRLQADADSARRELRVTKELSALDDLTQLYNRREMERLLIEDMERAGRLDRRLSVAMLDIDHFKNVNDLYGHQVGDQVLREAAQIIISTLRSSDRPARYGGEEFLLILPDTTGADVLALLDRLRKAFETHIFRVRHAQEVLELRLTVSIGAASFPEHGNTPENLVDASDHALYRAKSGGRNKVVEAE